MAKKISSWDDSWSMGRSSRHYRHFRRGGGDFGWWVEGFIATRHGFVVTYTQEDHTNIRFVWAGRIYSRNWEVEYSQQYLVTLAKRFVREITGLEKVG